MQIKLGEKIRELRHRDGRTQEALAESLGVTSQAVSRWETNGGYPDMEIIPSIANYFNITIDKLFGYDSDRRIRIDKILSEADIMIKEMSNMESCVALLNEAIAEFPSEAQILVRLVYALTILGYQKHGARRCPKEGADYYVNDIEYNAKNELFHEALRTFMRVWDIGIDYDDRQMLIPHMVRLYSIMGHYDKAEALAEKQDSVSICKECLLPDAVEDEKRNLSQGMALLALSKQLYLVMINAVQTNCNLAYKEAGVNKLLGIVHLYKTILDDGNCGEYHNDLMVLYRWCAIYTAKQGDIPKAMEYFEICFNHAEEFESVRLNESHTYTAALVSQVTVVEGKLPKASKNLWQGWQKYASEELIEAVKGKDKYSKCFLGM